MPWTLVTGGGKGLGAEICKALAAKGYNLVVHYRKSKSEAEAIVKSCQKKGVDAISIQADFLDKVSMEELILQLKNKEIENLINNVGSFHQGSALATSYEKWREVLKTNFDVPLFLIQSLVPSVIQFQGCIVNIGSRGVGSIRADAKFTAFNLSKMNLLMLTKSLAIELAPHNVSVNMVSPGELETSVTLSDYLSHIPMQKPGKLKEVARVVAFLLEKENHYITGQNIEVAGGLGL